MSSGMSGRLKFIEPLINVLWPDPDSISGVPVTSDESSRKDSINLIQFTSNRNGENPAVWIRPGYPSIDSARTDSSRLMQESRSRTFSSWALDRDTYSHDSIRIKRKIKQ